MAGFSQDIFEGISGLKFLSTDTLEIKNVFVWQGDTIRKDSIVYADINNDCIRFHYIDGNWTKWFCDSDIKKALNHVHNDQDTIKTNELITNVTFQNDTLKIIEQGFTWKVKIQNVETDPVFNSWNKDYNDLTNKPTLFSGDYNDLTNKPTITPGYNQSASYNKSTHIFSIIDANGSVSDTIPLATNVVDGLMSKEDKAKLDSDTDQSPENELNTNLIFDVETKELSITDAGGTRSVTIDINVGNDVNSYVGKIDVVSSTISVTWPDSFSTTNYFLRIDPYYVETIGGKSIRISNAVYDFVKTVSGFSLKLDTVAGFVEYFAADTTNIYPIEFGNYIAKEDIATSISSPGSDTKVPSEKALKSLFDTFRQMQYPSNGIALSNGNSWLTSIPDNHINWDAAYSWGNHVGLYRPISYVPSWSEITSTPFSFVSPSNGQIIRYNSTSGKFENWTPNYLTSFTELDPIFTSSSWYNTTNNSSNWNTAYSWGNHVGLYLQLSGGSLTGNLTFTNDNNGVNFYGGAKVYKRSGSGITIKRDNDDTDPYIENYAGTSWYKLWHEGNDGSGSGLDSDLLDGYNASSFIKTYGTQNNNIDSDYGEGFITFDPIPTGTPPISSPNIRTVNIGNDFNRRTQLAFPYNSDKVFFRRRTNSVWQSWNELWHNNNDGSGSGLDADLLDGQHSSYFTPTNDSRLSDTRVPTNATVTYSKVGIDLASSGTVTSSIDLSSKSIGYITLSGNTAFSFSNYQLGKTYILIVTANGYTPSFATSARHVFVNGNETLGTVGVFYIYLTCIDATTGSEKLLTTIMKGA